MEDRRDLRSQMVSAIPSLKKKNEKEGKFTSRLNSISEKNKKRNWSKISKHQQVLARQAEKEQET